MTSTTWFRPESPPLWSCAPPDYPDFRRETPEISLHCLGGTTEYFEKQLEMSKASEGTDMKVFCPEDDGSGEREFNMHTVIVLPQVPLLAGKATFKNGRRKRGKLKFRLTGVKASVFELIREYIYTGRGGEPTSENYYDYMHAVNLLQIQILFEKQALYALLQNPLRQETQDLCDQLSDRIPASVISYVTEFRSWWSQETAEGMPNAERLEALMESKPFDRFFESWKPYSF